MAGHALCAAAGREKLGPARLPRGVRTPTHRSFQAGACLDAGDRSVRLSRVWHVDDDLLLAVTREEQLGLRRLVQVLFEVHLERGDEYEVSGLRVHDVLEIRAPTEPHATAQDVDARFVRAVVVGTRSRSG